MEQKILQNRASGVLLHISCLPSPFGIGDLGPECYRFADFLVACRQRYWQILPLNPTQGSHGHSPYSSVSAFAGNPLLISPDLLVQEGWLNAREAAACRMPETDRVDYETVVPSKRKLLDLAYARFEVQGPVEDFDIFCTENAHWLNDFSIFMATKQAAGPGTWAEWPEDLRRRHPERLAAQQDRLSREIRQEKFFQFLFFRQWQCLKSYCNARGVRIIGDIPIYVDADSVDVWSQPEFFKLNKELRPEFVAGVPPDYFSKTGQRWGNPLYNWERLRQHGYHWWLERFAHILKLYDVVRIDHFRGLVAYWELPATEETAVNGWWVEAPATEFLAALSSRFPEMPIIVEDLGLITEDVRDVMKRFHLPGMKVLLFAFGEDNPAHPYLPHNYRHDSVVYTGTHDTNTLVGWFEEEAGEAERNRVFRYFGRVMGSREAAAQLCRLALMSTARLCVLPMQDLLGLPAAARMNRPATRTGNWAWRLLPDYPATAPTAQFAEQTGVYGRAAD